MAIGAGLRGLLFRVGRCASRGGARSGRPIEHRTLLRSRSTARSSCSRCAAISSSWTKKGRNGGASGSEPARSGRARSLRTARSSRSTRPGKPSASLAPGCAFERASGIEAWPKRWPRSRSMTAAWWWRTESRRAPPSASRRRSRPSTRRGSVRARAWVPRSKSGVAPRRDGSRGWRRCRQAGRSIPGLPRTRADARRARSRDARRRRRGVHGRSDAHRRRSRRRDSGLVAVDLVRGITRRARRRRSREPQAPAHLGPPSVARGTRFAFEMSATPASTSTRASWPSTRREARTRVPHRHTFASMLEANGSVAPLVAPVHTAMLVDAVGTVAFAGPDGHVGVANAGGVTELGEVICGRGAPPATPAPQPSAQPRRPSRPSAGFAGMASAGAGAFLVACEAGGLLEVKSDEQR